MARKKWEGKMKKLCLALTLLALAYSVFFAQNAFAARFSSGVQVSVYARHGGDDDRGHDGHSRYYRHERYYPSDFFFYNKIYYSPSRRYYHYYDVFPQKTYYYEAERTVIPNNPDYLPVTSIANMGSQGVPDEVIISEIERTHSYYKLNTEIITYLKQNGVGDKVIDYMIRTGEKRY
jgi:hypothetical protein